MVDAEDVGEGLTKIFSRASLGNIGVQRSIACGTTNVAKASAELSEEIGLTCSAGALATIISVGLSREKDQDACDPAAISES